MSSYSNGSTNARREEQTFAGKGRQRQRGRESGREREREMHSIATLSHSHKYLNFVTNRFAIKTFYSILHLIFEFRMNFFFFSFWLKFMKPSRKLWSQKELSSLMKFVEFPARLKPVTTSFSLSLPVLSLSPHRHIGLSYLCISGCIMWPQCVWKACDVV